MKLTAAIRAAKQSNRVPLVAEIKVYSPKDGDLLRGREPVEIVSQYEKGGACAISVVTEPEYFKGDIRIIEKIRENTRLPIFRKEFTREIEQIEETQKVGADAILLTACMLSAERLEKLNEYAHRLGLETVVEIHNEDDLRKLNKLDLDIISINNKDILNLEKDEDKIQPTLDLIDKIRARSIILSASGMRILDDIRQVMEAGSDAVLMGTALLTAENTARFVEEIVNLSVLFHGKNDKS
jgi:indole-3-glycerol phosphate synthase